jgi:hypothetical protein
MEHRILRAESQKPTYGPHGGRVEEADSKDGLGGRRHELSPHEQSIRRDRARVTQRANSEERRTHPSIPIPQHRCWRLSQEGPVKPSPVGPVEGLIVERSIVQWGQGWGSGRGRQNASQAFHFWARQEQFRFVEGHDQGRTLPSGGPGPRRTRPTRPRDETNGRMVP